jgi:16S rRNA (adenine1518-N6/adenine1519-N6)-dimethyltransferase
VKAPDAGELPPLREVIRALGLSARKSLGQNFILDLNLTRRIARAAGPLEGVTVIEIGPGPGGLTRALLMEGAAKVIAIERDSRCLPALADISAHFPGRLETLNADALEVDYQALARASGASRLRVAANLPYGAATPLLFLWLKAEPWPPWFDRLTLMFQREVAERIVAAPGNKAYGRLAVFAQWRTQPRILFNLPPEAFTPPPKVHSSVVEFRPRDNPAAAGSAAALERVTAAAFGQRRKMLRASLRSLGRDAEVLLARAGVEPALRAEQLSVDDFCRLSQALDDGQNGDLYARRRND